MKLDRINETSRVDLLDLIFCNCLLLAGDFGLFKVEHLQRFVFYYHELRVFNFIKSKTKLNRIECIHVFSSTKFVHRRYFLDFMLILFLFLFHYSSVKSEHAHGTF